MESPERGEVWLVDLGLAAKVRPALVVSVPFESSDYALIQIVPHTTQNAEAGLRSLCPFVFSRREPSMFKGCWPCLPQSSSAGWAV